MQFLDAFGPFSVGLAPQRYFFVSFVLRLKVAIKQCLSNENEGVWETSTEKKQGKLSSCPGLRSQLLLLSHKFTTMEMPRLLTEVRFRSQFS